VTLCRVSSSNTTGKHEVAKVPRRSPCSSSPKSGNESPLRASSPQRRRAPTIHRDLFLRDRVMKVRGRGAVTSESKLMHKEGQESNREDRSLKRDTPMSEAQRRRLERFGVP
jgi:hypothetical protein